VFYPSSRSSVAETIDISVWPQAKFKMKV